MTDRRTHGEQVAYEAGYRSGFYNVGRSPSYANRLEWSHAWRSYISGWNDSQKVSAKEPAARSISTGIL